MRMPPLPMRCTIERPSGSRDSFGQSNATTPIATDVPCYWWTGQSWVANNTQAPGVVAVDTERILFAPGQDVKPGDRITTLSDHLGNTVFSGDDYRVVQQVGVMRNHLDCTVRFGRSIGGRS